MAVPYTFGTATAAIPLSQLDSNFATAITIGNTAVQLGNTVTTLNNMTLANVTISSGTVTITNVAVTTANVSGTANISTLVVVGNETVGGNTTITGNITATTIKSTTSLNLYAASAYDVNLYTGSTNTARLSSNVNGVFTVGTQGNVGALGTDYGTIGAWGSAGGGFRIYRGTGAGTPIATIYADNTGVFVNGSEAVPMVFSTNGTERARFNAGAPILCLAGGSTTATGTGIAFPSTQSASSNVNTLDDYEEGTFTPTCTLATPGTSSTSSAVGAYTKVGNLVTVTGRLTFTKGTGTGDLSFGGLPFASTSTATYQSSGALSLDSVGVAGKVYYFLLVNSSTTPIFLSVTQVGGVVAVASATDLGVSGASIRYMFSYQTD
jgi:hypothetical protein